MNSASDEDVENRPRKRLRRQTKPNPQEECVKTLKSIDATLKEWGYFYKYKIKKILDKAKLTPLTTYLKWWSVLSVPYY